MPAQNMFDMNVSTIFFFTVVGCCCYWLAKMTKCFNGMGYCSCRKREKKNEYESFCQCCRFLSSARSLVRFASKIVNDVMESATITVFTQNLFKIDYDPIDKRPNAREKRNTHQKLANPIQSKEEEEEKTATHQTIFMFLNRCLSFTLYFYLHFSSIHCVYFHPICIYTYIRQEK